MSSQKPVTETLLFQQKFKKKKKKTEENEITQMTSEV